MNAKIMLITLAAVLLVPAMVYSQFDIKYISQEPFGDDVERPKVYFPHDRHNKLAEIDGDEHCSMCHHMWEDGKLVEDDNSAGIPCSDCHKVGYEHKGAPELTNAYHQQCMGCHDDMGRGPITCGECHTGEVTGPVE